MTYDFLDKLEREIVDRINASFKRGYLAGLAHQSKVDRDAVNGVDGHFKSYDTNATDEWIHKYKALAALAAVAPKEDK